jgi:hypothetical protein
MALAAKDAMGRSKLKVVADRGDFSGPAIRACDLNDTSAYIPKPLTSASRKKGLFTKADFVYESRNDVYRCPAGERAIHRFSTVENEMTLKMYWPGACPRFHLKERCSPSVILVERRRVLAQLRWTTSCRRLPARAYWLRPSRQMQPVAPPATANTTDPPEQRQ